ncbi:Uu.00g084790.m01.CDS01 [Anthostomella pinea]|uniref:Spindle pole body component n=1 Tax=Anthostomella pinea TaxID=933095 RepID=A0AAI8YJV7_9PEZI|nr:Uu.00g084790.m01.CDS01 [Anthostomella pinea]
MAFAAELGALTQELVEVITSTSSQSEPTRFNLLRESSLRKLRHHSFLRTNQFEVQESLDGFEEHFRVLNRDGLADALRERLDALAEQLSKWTPEALKLLLLLSDQPIQKSRLSDLELLKDPDDVPGPDLKWADIAREEGWDKERELWENVEFGGYSSEDENADDGSDASVESEDTSPFSVEARYRRRATEYLDDLHDVAGLDTVKKSQSWRSGITSRDPRGKAQKTTITELQAVREILSMLNGLENSLFDKQGVPSLNFQLAHSSWGVYKALLNSFGEAGRQLSVLRSFASHPQRIPLLQVFQDAVGNRLMSFDSVISMLQTQYVSISQDVVVSLAKIVNDIKPHLQPLASLAEMIQELQQANHPRPFHYLELLFDAAAVAQMGGNEDTHGFFSKLFFECFEVYLRPIRLWMARGELIDGDKTFFISSTPTEVPKRQVWTDQFKLRRTAEGTLYVPRFLQPAASKIFTTGKSVVVLKLLGKHRSIGNQPSQPLVQFDAGLASEVVSFAPFSEIFNSIFEQWMQSKHHTASAILRKTLFQTCSLWSVLEALQQVYLMSDGSRSNMFAGAIFNNIDLLNPNWHDRFILTAVAQESFDTLVDSHRITVSVSTGGADVDVNDARKSVRKGLPSVRVAYRLSWPTRVILSDESLTQYQSVFTFLLQLQRANSVLNKHRLMSDGVADMVPEQATYYGIRTRLLWFCNTLQSYLTALVLGPLVGKLRDDLEAAEDVDAMITSHSAFAKRMIDETCLGSKLDPIHQCFLDIFDLTIKLQDARRLESERPEEETQELPRLSVMSSPTKADRKIYVKASEEEDETFLSEQDKSGMMLDTEKTYAGVLSEVRADFDRHLKFICGGLRGVARASGNDAASKWDTLAEMLEVGIRGSLMP